MISASGILNQTSQMVGSSGFSLVWGNNINIYNEPCIIPYATHLAIPVRSTTNYPELSVTK